MLGGAALKWGCSVQRTSIISAKTLILTGIWGNPMSTEPINYEAVIADLEAKKAHIESTIAALRVIAGMIGLGITPPPGSPSGGGTPAINGTKPAADAFLGKSIPEAAKIYLTSQRRKLSTQELMDAMEAGGLPGSKYNTVYAILSRRENKVGDIINMKGDWALAEWYPNYVKKPKKGAVSEPLTDEDSSQAPDIEEDEPATA
jgi:hypothetical protein